MIDALYLYVLVADMCPARLGHEVCPVDSIPEHAPSFRAGPPNETHIPIPSTWHPHQPTHSVARASMST